MLFGEDRVAGLDIHKVTVEGQGRRYLFDVIFFEKPRFTYL